MGGPVTLALGPGEYRIVPSEGTREWDNQAGELLSGESVSEFLENRADFHEYTVEDANGRPVLELLKKRVELEEGEGGLLVDLFDGEDGMFGYKHVYLFRPPEDDPVFILEIPRGFRFVYTLTDIERDEVLATWEKSRRLFGNWHLKTPRRGHVATVKWSRWLRELNPRRRQGTYVLYGVDGSELGEFRRVGLDDGELSDTLLSRMDVDVPASNIPVEVGLAFAFGIFLEAQKSHHTHT